MKWKYGRYESPDDCVAIEHWCSNSSSQTVVVWQGSWFTREVVTAPMLMGDEWGSVTAEAGGFSIWDTLPSIHITSPTKDVMSANHDESTGPMSSGPAVPQRPIIVQAVLSDQPLSVDDAALAAVQSDTAGAVVSFSGVVRNHDGGRAVERLTYTAHPTAHQILIDVVEAVAAEYARPNGVALDSPVRIWAAHRVGSLQVGEPALVCAVSAGHREQAFDVCSAVVDRIKAEVPIWKQQFFSDGTIEWVGATG